MLCSTFPNAYAHHLCSHTTRSPRHRRVYHLMKSKCQVYLRVCIPAPANTPANLHAGFTYALDYIADNQKFSIILPRAGLLLGKLQHFLAASARRLWRRPPEYSREHPPGDPSPLLDYRSPGTGYSREHSPDPLD